MPYYLSNQIKVPMLHCEGGNWVAFFIISSNDQPPDDSIFVSVIMIKGINRVKDSNENAEDYCLVRSAFVCEERVVKSNFEGGDTDCKLVISFTVVVLM